jgi:hypothetical protein
MQIYASKWLTKLGMKFEIGILLFRTMQFLFPYDV